MNPDDEKRLHPYALERFNKWRTDILSSIPQLGELNADEIEADVNTYLADCEMARLAKCRAEILDWLRACLDIADNFSPYPYDRDVIDPMLEIKLLLQKVYSCKEAKVNEEKEKRDYEKRWQAAFRALAPPLKGAKIYLSSEEYVYFEGSIFGAVNASLEKGEKYSSDERASEYCRLCAVIRERHEECQRKKAAESESWHDNRTLIDEIEKLKSGLYHQPQKIEDCFERNVVDLRFTGQRFVELLSAKERASLRARIDRIARDKLQELVSGALTDCINCELNTFLFLLPSADYSFEGVPCLDFILDAFAVVETEVWLRPARKRFGNYLFTLPLMEHKCGSCGSYFKMLEEPELLGYHYVVLTPADTGICLFWQRVPLVLIKGLMLGDAEPVGTVIIRASEGETEYRVENFKMEVTIPDSFASYMIDIGGIDGMETLGILSEKLTDHVRSKLSELETSNGREMVRDGQARAFTAERLISSLTGLGVPKKYAEMVTGLIPTGLSLEEAIKLAMQKYTEILDGKNNEE
jgi:hypothetical protein